MALMTQQTDLSNPASTFQSEEKLFISVEVNQYGHDTASKALSSVISALVPSNLNYFTCGPPDETCMCFGS